MSHLLAPPLTVTGKLEYGMPYVVWTKENGQPRILAIMDQLFASSGVTLKHSYHEFERLVGKENAEAALARFYREED